MTTHGSVSVEMYTKVPDYELSRRVLEHVPIGPNNNAGLFLGLSKMVQAIAPPCFWGQNYPSQVMPGSH